MPSAREVAELQARREWERQYNEQQREAEDREQYQQSYLDTFKKAGRATKGWDVEPLSFEQWRDLMPSDEPDPAVRAAQAAFRSLTNEQAQVAKSVVVNRPLSDGELEHLGFDIDYRIDSASQLSIEGIRDTFAKLQSRVPEFGRELHFDVVADFLKRNRLTPNLQNASAAFSILLRLGVIERKLAPEPEPVNPALNEHGVNLAIEPDPRWEAEQRQKDYRTKIVAVDPRDGAEYTEYQLDRTDSETYRRLAFGEFGNPRITNVIQPR